LLFQIELFHLRSILHRGFTRSVKIDGSVGRAVTSSLGSPWRTMQREFPVAPLMGVGAVIVDEGRVLLIRRGHEPMKGHWSLPGGLLELGESLIEGVQREVREETGLIIEVLELIELLDRIHRQDERVRYHYVIADYLCQVVGGNLQADSDADAVRWVERAEWNSHSALLLDPITVQVIEKGWQRWQEAKMLKNADAKDVAL